MQQNSLYLKLSPKYKYCKYRFPLGLENLEKWENIIQSGKGQKILNRLEKSGKITQNIGKLWEFQTNVICYFSNIEMNSVLFAKMGQVFSLKNIKKILENGKRIGRVSSKK